LPRRPTCTFIFADDGHDRLDDAKLRSTRRIAVAVPWSFKNEVDSRAYVMELARRFHEYPLVLEVRRASWMQDDVLDWLAEHGIGRFEYDSGSSEPVWKG
jgi:uncharacterized protein YecE (DUF72 family)